MSTLATHTPTAAVPAHPAPSRVWVGPLGAALLLTATAILFLSLPHAAGPDGVEKMEAFYGEGGGHRIVPVSEPFALIGGFLMLWFSATLREYLRQAGGDDRHATVAFAGTVAFSILLPVALLVQATPAGQLSFSDGFQLDVSAAMLFHHLGYVLFAAAAVAGSVAAAATGGVIRDTAVLGRGMYRASLAVAVLGLLAFPFVYAALLAFVVWVMVVGVRLPASLAER